jgi:hypothetical protein
MRSMVVFCVLIFLSGFALAVSGVSPGRYEIAFEPGLEKEVSFDFIFDEGVESEIYVDGDLGRYVSLDKEIILGSERVVARVSLPENLSSYGVNDVRVIARQLPGEGSSVSLSAEIRGVIRILVPYQGRKFSSEIRVNDFNEKGILKGVAKISNLGDDAYVANPVIQIFDEEGMVEELRVSEFGVDSLSDAFFDFVGAYNYSFGRYIAVVLVEDDEGFSRGDVEFKVGKNYVDIVDWTRELSLGRIERIDVEISSFSSEVIEGVYCDIYVDGVKMSTPKVSLKAWENETLSIYIDTSKLKEGVSEARLDLYFGSEKVSRDVVIEVVKRGYVIYYVAVIVFLLILAIYFKFRKNG